MILYTHIFNLLAKLLCVGASIAVMVGIAFGVTHILGAENPIALVILFVLGVPLAIATFVLLGKICFPAGNWLYLGLIRQTWVKWAEARELSPLFQRNNRGEWLPMREISKMPKAERVPYMRSVLVRLRNKGLFARRRLWRRRST